MPTFTIAKGIRYLKVNKINSSGSDLSTSLQELDKIRIKYTDIGVVEYEIQNIAEYPEYYLYTTKFTNATSSVDEEILNYDVSASVAFGITPDVTGSYIVPWTNDPPNAIVTGNSLGYLADSTGYVTYENTPNRKIAISASTDITYESVDVGTSRLYVSSSINGILAQTSYTSAGTGTYSNVVSELNLDYTPLNTEQISVWVGRVAGNITSSINSIGFSIEVSESLSPQSSNDDLIILEPFFNNNFEGSDCDVLYGNVDELIPNNFYFDVDYSNGISTAVNFNLIMQGNAVPSTVNNYNYSLRRSINPRYNGSTVFQLNPNKWTEGDDSYGKTPSIITEKQYFAYFDWGQNVRPEIMGKSHYHIKYLIDEEGVVYNPTLNSPYYWNLIRGLEAGSNIKFVLRGAEFATPLANTQIYNVHRSGKRVQPILYSQLTYEDIGNVLNTDYTESIWFENSTGIVGDASDFTFSITTTTPYNVSSFSQTEASFDTIVSDDLGYWDLGTHTYTFTTAPSAPFDLAVGINITSVVSSILGNVYVLKNDVIVATLGSSTGSPSPITSAGYYADFFEFFSAEVGDTLKLRVVNGGPGNFDAALSCTLYPQTLSSSSIDAPYWTTGSLSKNVLTGSNQITGSLLNNRYMKQTDISGSGFDSIVNHFSILPGDEIRFEGKESKAYTISSASINSSGKLFVYLNKDVYTPTNIDFFLLRRYSDDPGYVILDFNKEPSLDIGDGFLLPEYPTQKLLDNYDVIVNKLSSDGLIS